MCDDFRMQSRFQGASVASEPAEFREEVRRMFQELGRSTADDALAGECVPPLDVFETDDSVELRMDLPGVASTAVRVAVKGQTVLIVGHKSPGRARSESSFHLVERGYGRFARAVRLAASCDTSRARATLTDGELRVSLPRIADRRGRSIRVTISSESPST
jgi:HSP20 family protein